MSLGHHKGSRCCRRSKDRTGYNLCYQRQLWWDHDGNDSSWLLLNTYFFSELVTRPVPIDINRHPAVARPVEIDLYAWLTWHPIRSSRVVRPEVVPWADLHQQLGCDYTDLRVFKFKVINS
nr:hypothetical protein [uncultured bacterium]